MVIRPIPDEKEEKCMKRFGCRIVGWMLTMVVLLAMIPMGALAENSRENRDINRVVVDIPEEEEPTTAILEITEDTEDTEQIREEVQATFRLTVYYIYLDGTPAAPTYRATLDVQTHYEVDSPTVEGFKPSDPLISGDMPMRNVEYTVLYLPEEAAEEDPVAQFIQSVFEYILNIFDYETPLGLPITTMNIGISGE